MDCLRRIQGQLQSDIPTGGVAHHMRPLDSQLIHQRSTLGGLLGQTDCAGNTAAASASGAMIAHQAIMVGKRVSEMLLAGVS
jgi:hypothetical protein